MGWVRPRRGVTLDLDPRIVLAVAVGSAAGGTLRYVVSGLVTRGDFPWGTFVVNFTGSLVLAYLVFGDQAWGWLGPEARAVVAIGMLGSYTTMSTFSVETVTLAAEGGAASAGWNWALNAGACVLGAAASRALVLAQVAGG